MDNEISKSMLRYLKNKDKYNERAKKYFNEIYYPQHRKEILQKSKEQRLTDQKYKPKSQPKIKKNIKEHKEIKKNNVVLCLDDSLDISFD
jgi:hypothetical protein